VLLVVDVGNTHTVLGLYDGEQLAHSWRLRTSRERTTDEWGLTFRSFFELNDISFKSISGMAISSVVPPAIHALKRSGKRYFHVETLVIGPGVKTGLSILYDNPKEVGADRVVNAVAAYEKAKQACIVVDFGTATTFDCISPDGKYLGGVIAPGLKVSLDALVARAAKLPRVEIVKPAHIIGKNTEEAIQAGTLFGYVALVDGLVERLTKEMGHEVTVIATGGLSSVIASESQTISSLEPNLTLEGLRIIYNKNQ